jgi:FKBP-type peptidyl-prolyl cis-trans isomerase
LFAGETIEILEKNEHGWWLGLAQRNGSLYRGYFPRNYVKEKPRAAPAPPPRPAELKKTEVEEVTENVETLRVAEPPTVAAVTSPHSGARVSSVRRAAFSLRSLTAFDDLSEKGYAVEFSDRSGTVTSGNKPILTDRVEIQIIGLIWDGASTDTREFGRGILKFTIGKSQVPRGLETGVQMLLPGQGATVTCSPAQAYGAAGNPPLVPPNSFVIFHINLMTITKPTNPDIPAEGPPEFFTSGIASAREGRSNNNNANRRSLLLVNSNDSATITAGTTDTTAGTR